MKQFINTLAEPSNSNMLDINLDHHQTLQQHKYSKTFPQSTSSEMYSTQCRPESKSRIQINSVVEMEPICL